MGYKIALVDHILSCFLLLLFFAPFVVFVVLAMVCFGGFVWYCTVNCGGMVSPVRNGGSCSRR